MPISKTFRASPILPALQPATVQSGKITANGRSRMVKFFENKLQTNNSKPWYQNPRVVGAIVVSGALVAAAGFGAYKAIGTDPAEEIATLTKALEKALNANQAEQIALEAAQKKTAESLATVQSCTQLLTTLASNNDPEIVEKIQNCLNTI